MKLYKSTFDGDEIYFIMNYNYAVAFDGNLYRIKTLHHLINLVNNHQRIESIDNEYYVNVLLSKGELLKEFKDISELKYLKTTNPEWFI